MALHRCLRAMRVMLRGVLRGAAWCCVVCFGGVLRIHVLLRGPTWLHGAA